VHKKLRPQRQSYQDLVPTGIMPLPSFAPGAARSFARYSLFTKVFSPSAGAASAAWTSTLKKLLYKLTFSRGRPGGFLRSLRNYSCRAGKYLPESRLLQTAYLLLHALSGSWLLGFDGLSAATQYFAHSGNHRVALEVLFHASDGAAIHGMGVYIPGCLILT